VWTVLSIAPPRNNLTYLRKSAYTRFILELRRDTDNPTTLTCTEHCAMCIHVYDVVIYASVYDYGLSVFWILIYVLFMTTTPGQPLMQHISWRWKKSRTSVYNTALYIIIIIIILIIIIVVVVCYHVLVNKDYHKRMYRVVRASVGLLHLINACFISF